MNPCPECRGKGTITLFTSVSPCKACGGTGKAPLALKLTVDKEGMNADLAAMLPELEASIDAFGKFFKDALGQSAKP